MPQIKLLPDGRKISKIRGRFEVLIGVGFFCALCFYFPMENASQSLAEWCRETIGFLVWAPLGVLIAIIIACFLWSTLCIRCPTCNGRIRSGRSLSDRRTLLYPCARCDIVWDSDIEQMESSSSGG